MAEKQKVPMDKLSLKDLQRVDERFGEDVMAAFDYEASVEKRSGLCVTCKKSLLEQVERLEEVVL